MEQIKILSLNVSEKKGIVKKPVQRVLLDHNGIVGDSHAGIKNRQVSMLDRKSIALFEKSTGKKVRYGDFAENITLNLMPGTIAPLDCFRSGKVMLQVSQIGKTCHGKNCAIYTETGDCIMPTEGIFCRVLSGGELRINNILDYNPRIFNIRIITLSDRASQGDYHDLSGQEITNLINDFMAEAGRAFTTAKTVIPDDKEMLESLIKKFLDEKTDIIFTTGGTGIGPRDITPDVVRPFLDKELTGLIDYIRLKYGANNPRALISRSVAGVTGKTLVYCLPGSVNGVKEYMPEILKTLLHSIYMLNDLDIHK